MIWLGLCLALIFFLAVVFSVAHLDKNPEEAKEFSKRPITHRYVDPFAFSSPEFRAQMKTNERLREIEDRLKKIENKSKEKI